MNPSVKNLIFFRVWVEFLYKDKFIPIKIIFK